MKRYERKIEKFAKRFVDAPCSWDCRNCTSQQIDCRFLNDKESFKAGALFEKDRMGKAKKIWKQVKNRQTY